MTAQNKFLVFLILGFSISISPQIIQAQPGPEDSGPNEAPPSGDTGGDGVIENDPPGGGRRPPPESPGGIRQDFDGPGDNGPPSLSAAVPGLGGQRGRVPPGGGRRVPCKAVCLETRRGCLLSKRCGYGDFLCAQECEDGTYACISACRQSWYGGRGRGVGGNGGGGGCWKEFRVCAEGCENWDCRRDCRDRARECRWARRRSMCQSQGQVMD